MNYKTQERGLGGNREQRYFLPPFLTGLTGQTVLSLFSTRERESGNNGKFCDGSFNNMCDTKETFTNRWEEMFLTHHQSGGL